MEPQGSSRSHRAAAARLRLQRSAASQPPRERGAAAMTNLIAAAIAAADVITASAPPDASQDKPRLLVESSDPDRTVAALRNILADAGLLFDRGVPVRLTFDQIQGRRRRSDHVTGRARADGSQRLPALRAQAAEGRHH